MTVPVGPREYIGDGVYAYQDVMGQIWLETEREYGKHVIALDRSTFGSLLDYARRVWGNNAV